ncbi:unnamed protein product [Symbiodinium sp. CCMP2592]|nr:unnamed protein product [Symbiodinium sp. CCMP2592]
MEGVVFDCSDASSTGSAEGCQWELDIDPSVNGVNTEMDVVVTAESSECLQQEICSDADGGIFFEESMSSGSSMSVVTDPDAELNGADCDCSAGDTVATDERISTLVSAFRAGVFMVEFLQQSFGEHHLRQSSLNWLHLFSSQCSGIASAEQAYHVLEASLEAVLGWPKQWQQASVCEINAKCIDILKKKVPDDCCIFMDIFESVPASWDSKLGPAPTIQERWEALCSAWQGNIKLKCRAHGGLCRQKKSTLNVAGTPCQPWSRCGKKLGGNDRRSDVTLAWLCWLLHAQPAVAIHENVVGFDSSIITTCVGSLYSVIILPVKPGNAGFVFAGRPRQFAVLVRKDLVITHDMLRVLHAASEYINNRVGCSQVSACMAVTSDEERLQCENKARKKRGLHPLTKASDDWSYLLTDKQRQYLKNYIQRWTSSSGLEHPPALFPDDLLMNLAQDPLVRPGTFRYMPTLRASGNILWSPAKKRWMLESELALAMGWPRVQAVASAASMPVDNFDYSVSQLGNSMHVYSVTLVLAVALACTKQV